MIPRAWIGLGCILAFAGLVIKGVAYHRLAGEGAAALRETLFIATEAHMFSSLAIIVAGILMTILGNSRLLTVAAATFVVGIVLFCGGIYSSLGGDAGFRSLTPYGGAFLLAGWLFLAAGALLGSKIARPASTGT